MLSAGEFRYANELVEFIRQETGDHFHIHVAAYPEVHPQAASGDEDFKNFKRKVDAGADAAITQYFYNAEAYFYFVDQCEKNGINIPIVPGIMPIIQYAQLFRFSEMCGADIPRWMRKRLEAFGDDRASIQAFGLELVTKLCQRLLDAGSTGTAFLYDESIQAYHGDFGQFKAIIEGVFAMLSRVTCFQFVWPHEFSKYISCCFT